VRVGVIGSGRIGATVAGLAAAAGHDVAIANTRGPESLAGVAADLGVRAETVAGAAAHGELVLVAIPVKAYDDLPAAELTGKVVLDAGNYYPERDGRIAALADGSTTSSELLAARLPRAHVVKAFNTVYWEHLRDRGGPDADEPRLAVFLAGDDPDANERAAAFIRELGFAPVATGDLAGGGRRQEIGGPLAGAQVTEQEAAALLA
jgi:predicted dinucleotide-binding enzyme